MSHTKLIDNIYKSILEAKGILENIIHKTPLDLSRTFSEICGGKVFLKLENLQKTGSFKVRGAYYKISKLSYDAKRRGVIAASAGNHAQGVAYSAKMAGVPCKIVMPIFAPIAKIQATKSYGAEVILYGINFDEAYIKAREIAERNRLTFIHAFDDPQIIAGQGTIGLEILEVLPNPDIIVIPIGGGGLISGISIALRKKLGRKIKIIGVQSEAYPSMAMRIKGISLKKKPLYTIADGIAVKKPGELTSKIISELVDDIIVVNDDEIARAIFLLLERAKTLAEGAGAISLAAVLSGEIDVRGKKVVCIISGGNISMSTLMKILGREQVRLGRLLRLRGRLPDYPGSLRNVLSILSEAYVNVVDIISEKYDPRIPPSEAEIELVVEAPSEEKLEKLLKRLEKEGYYFSVEKP
ncbi:MAG: threonine ammonia-lyase [Candidatus Njordarchaeales archaeon]